MSEREHADIARGLASIAYARRFSEERGVGSIADTTFYYVTDSSDDVILRGRQLAQLGRELHQRGIRVLSDVTYPTSGPDAGLSRALLLDALAATVPTEMVLLVLQEVWRRIVSRNTIGPPRELTLGEVQAVKANE